MRKLIIGLAAMALAFPALSSPAFAQKHDDEAERVYDEAEDRYDEDETPPPDEDYVDEGEVYRGETWRDRDGQLRCRRGDSTTGLIIGGGAGALIGRGIDTRGERGTGTILGAVAGALVGRAVERSAENARCR